MSEKIALVLLARYLDGTASREERAAVDEWIGGSAERRGALEALQAAWAEDAARLDGDYDIERAWRRLSADALHPARPRRRRRSFTGRALAVAATLVTVAAGGVLWRAQTETPAAEIAAAPSEYAAPRGRRASFQLADGTEVTLNSDSRLRLAPDYGQRGRNVELDGEAFFDVVHDEDQPFNVRTRHGTVRVLGTRFGVQAYADAEADRIALVDGSVAVLPAAAQSQPAIRLRPGQVASLSAQGQVRPVSGVSAADEVAWTRGVLVLDNLPLEEAARRIGRWYDLEVTIADSVLLQRPVIGSYRQTPVTEVLTLITAAIGARYDRNGRTVTIRLAN